MLIITIVETLKSNKITGKPSNSRKTGATEYSKIIRALKKKTQNKSQRKIRQTTVYIQQLKDKTGIGKVQR